jgi:predicted membrane protein
MERIERRERRAARKNNGNVFAGILLLIVGGGLLMRQMDYPLPAWLFTWPMIVIVAGVFIGAINRFRDFGWLIICATGFFFLADDIWPDFKVADYIWPAVIILVGLALLFRPRFKTHFHSDWGWKNSTADPGADYTEAARTFKANKKASKEDVIDVAAVFGSIKKSLFSKTFKGGEIVTVFGGVEIDLSQADFEGKVVIESVQIFGGATLIVPPTWQVRSEAVAIFGGIEDNRKNVVKQEPERILVLEGFVMFGGVEIKSY